MISGSSVPFYVGRKLHLLAYVSIGEWETYELMRPKDGLRYLLYCSLHRASPLISQRRVNRLIRWHKKCITAIVAVICKISLPPESVKISETETPKDTIQGLKVMYRSMSHLFTWTPQQIADMSPLQLYEYMVGGKDGTGLVKMSVQEARAFQQSRIA